MPPTIWMTPNQPLQCVNYQYSIQDPKTCGTQSLKVENLRTQVAAVEKEGQALLDDLGRTDAFNKAELFLGLVAKTCYSFLDLAAAMAGDAIPGPLGKRVGTVATGGMAAIDMTEKTTQAVVGTGTWSGVGEQSIRSGLAMMGTGVDSTVGKVALSKANQAFAVKDMISSSKSGDARGLRTSSVEVATSNIDLALSLAKDEGVAGAGKWGAGLSTIKAAQRYHEELGKLLDQYLSNKETAAEMKFRVKSSIRMNIKAVNKHLDAALKELEACKAGQ